jgi:alpha-L-rhamnosidase
MINSTLCWRRPLSFWRVGGDAMSGAPTGLKTEYLTEPLGLAVRQPRFSWISGDQRPAERQTAWRVQVASTAGQLASDAPDLWDSGWVADASSVGIRYQGTQLNARQRCCWRVALRDSDGQSSPWSPLAWFELGLLGEADWHADWITAGMAGSPARAAQVPVLRRFFELPPHCSRVRLYLAVLGDALLTINGRPLPLLPTVWSDFHRYLHYQVLDLGRHLEAGTNELQLVLADGRYSGAIAGVREHYGKQPGLRAQLEVQQADADEPQLLLGTGPDWQWRPSAWLQADLELGEQQRPLLSHFEQPDQEDPAAWQAVRVLTLDAALELVPLPRAALQPLPASDAVTLEGIRQRRAVGPDWQHWEYEVDTPSFGRVHLDWPASQPPPPLLWLDYAQRGTAGASGSQPAPQDQLALRDLPDGAGWRPELICRPLQQLRIAAPLPAGGQAAPLRLRVEPWSGAGEPSFQLQTDHGLVNQWFNAVHAQVQRIWLDVPRLPPDDLPQVGQVPVQALAGLQFANPGPVLRRWLSDVCGAFGANGTLAPVEPWPPGWSQKDLSQPAVLPDTVPELCWMLYRYTDDRDQLKLSYPRLLAAFWAADGLHDHSDQPLWLASRFRAAQLLLRMAALLGHHADVTALERAAGGLRQQFRQQYVTPAGRLAVAGLNASVAALHAGLLSGEPETASVLSEIRGALTAPAPAVRPELAGALLQALAISDEAGVLGQALLNPAPGAWFARLHTNMTGTAVDAAWLAAIGDWLFSQLAGFQLDTNLARSRNAFRHIRLAPAVGLSAGGDAPIRYLRAHFDSPYGRFGLQWEVSGLFLRLRLQVPANTTATLVLPGQGPQRFEAGEHSLSLSLGPPGDDGIPVLEEALT